MKLSKEIKEKIFTIKKQLNIQRVINTLKDSHHMPLTEGKTLARKGNRLLRQLSIGKDNEKEFLDFLQYAKKLQSFESENSTLPPIISDEENITDSEKLDSNENVDSNDANNEKKEDNIKEE